VALTLPEDAIQGLRKVHRDLGWAIVKLLEDGPRRASAREGDIQPDVELVTVADRRSLIVVNREVIRNLPGVNIIPLSGNRAFLALDIGRGMSDLELAVLDRLADPAIDRRERQALVKLRSQLTTWRRDQTLQFHTRAIIVVERLAKKPSDRDGATARGAAAKRAAAKVWAQIPGAVVTGLSEPQNLTDLDTLNALRRIRMSAPSTVSVPPPPADRKFHGSAPRFGVDPYPQLNTASAQATDGIAMTSARRACTDRAIPSGMGPANETRATLRTIRHAMH
jgi:hypothetical protein